jgi:hypothetical protein
MTNITNQDVLAQVTSMWPYVIAVYAVLWAGLMLYVGVTLRRLGKLEQQLALVEDAMAKRA